MKRNESNKQYLSIKVAKQLDLKAWFQSKSKITNARFSHTNTSNNNNNKVEFFHDICPSTKDSITVIKKLNV